MYRNTSKPVKIKMGSVEAVLDAYTRKTIKFNKPKNQNLNILS